MKTLEKLYELLLSTYIDRGLYICIRIEMLRNEGLITPNEFKLLTEHFLSQFPSKTMHPEFYHSLNFHKGNSLGKTGAWFTGSKQIRIDFLKKIISTL